MEHTNCCHGDSKKHNSGIKDPVCGMDVDPKKTEHHFKHKSQEYHFCSEKCLNKFKESPEKYLEAKPDNSAEKAKAEKEGTIYTCPMHPEVEQIGPGSCPKCGMALEPKNATAEEDTSELDDMTRRFWVSAALSLPVLILVMLDHLPSRPLEAYISSMNAMWVEFALATPVMLWGAIPFFKRAWESIVNRHLNMFTLIALGTGVAYGYSVIGALFPSLFIIYLLLYKGIN